MVVVSLYSLSGKRVTLIVQNKEVTLKDTMKEITALFGKPSTQTWVALAAKKEKHTEPESQPFLDAKDGDTYLALFWKREFLELAFKYGGEKRILMVKRSMALRSVQQLLCQAFYQRFPMHAATLKITGIVYDDFDSMPFLTVDEVETEVDVEFELSSDMYHFDVIYRRRQPSPDPFDTIPELVLE